MLLGQANFPENGPLFIDTVVPRIDIFVNPDTLEWLYEHENLESNIEFHAAFVYDNGTIRDSINPVGFRLRGNTSRYSQKKSFKISFNTFTSGGKYYGVEKLNLNGEHNDPSIIRSKVCWDILRKWEIPAPRANHVEVYINNNYYGLYINVEHIDEEFVKSRFGKNDGNLFKCLWPADLDYLGSNPDLYKLESGDRRVYQLKTNKETDDYTDLAQFIDILNNTPDNELVCKLGAFFNVYDYLKVIAADILTGNWDGPIYNQNNFYLYHNTTSGKFEYIPYDLDNTMGIDWIGRDWANRNIYDWAKHGDNVRPIYTRLINHPEFREQYSFYIKKLVTETLNMDSLTQRIEKTRSMISPFVINDPYYPLDYGYTFSDFLNSYYQALGSHVDYGLIPYLNTRMASILQQLENPNMKPVIKYIQHHRASPSELQIRAFVDIQHPPPIIVFAEFTLEYNDYFMDLYDDGNHNDGEAGDLIYGNSVNNIPLSASLSYQINVSDNLGNQQFLPCIPVFVPAYGSDTPLLFINEFMASNDTTIADETGNYADWIEVYNGDDEAIWLGNKFLTDNLDNTDKWQMPDVELEAGGFALFWADGKPHLGPYHTNFKLSKSGEEIGIFSELGTSIDGLSYGSQSTDISYGRLPNGDNNWILFTKPTPGSSNMPNAIVEDKSKLSFEVYPNPVSGHTVYFTSGINCRIFNTSGEQVFSGNEVSVLDVSTYNKGLYIIVSDKGLRRKLIIQ